MSIDGFPTDSGSESISGSRELPSSITAGKGMVTESGGHVIDVTISLDGTTIDPSQSYQSFGSGASLVPLIIILFLAITTQMVELSLGVGVFVGACMISGTLIQGFKSTLDHYILGALADVDHGYVYLFALFMSGLVGMIEKSGGLMGFTKAMGRLAKTTRTAQLAAFGTGLVIFFDDYANILVAGSAMRPILDAMSVSREKLAFIVDATSAPIASLIPVSSWVGFEVGLIQTEIDKIIGVVGAENLTVSDSGFTIFLKTIAYRYYPIFMLFLMASLIISQRDYGPMLFAERKVVVYGLTDGGPGGLKSAGGEAHEDDSNKASPDTPELAWNMLVPILFLIFYIFYLLIQTGLEAWDGEESPGFLDIMAYSDSYSALLWGTIGAALTGLMFYMLQFKKDGNLVRPTLKSFTPGILAKCVKKDDTDEDKYPPRMLMTPREGMDAFLVGMEKIFPALIVLTLAWASGTVMTSIGLDRLFSQLIVESDLEPGMLPTISFIVSIFIAFATGTSWGTMTIMFPLLLFPAYMASDGDEEIFYGTTAGILSGAVAGDHMSPISDTTVLSALASQCGLIEHVKTQAPYVGLQILWAIIVGTVPVGLKGYPNGVAILMGFIVTLLTAIFLAVRVVSPHGRFDIFTELMLKCKPDPETEQLKKDTIQYFETGEFVVKKDEEMAAKKLDSSSSEDKEVEMAPIPDEKEDVVEEEAPPVEETVEETPVEATE